MSLQRSLRELQKNEKLSVKREVKKELTRIKKKILRAKKCCMCDGLGQYAIKGSIDFYCKTCAKQCFGSLDHLRKIA